MNKYKVYLPLIAVLAFFLSQGSASAHAKIPNATFNCNNNNCFADQIWDGGTNGASVQFTVDKPGFSDANAFYNKYLYLYGYVGSQKTVIGEAVTKGNGFPSYANYCGGGGSSTTIANYFIYTYDAGGKIADHRCYPIPAGDINHLITITAINFDCEGDGLRDDIDLQIQGFASSYSDCIEAEISGYSAIDDKMQFYGTVTNHQVWGGHWYNSAYIDSGYHVVDQTRLPDSLNQNQPPQQYWNTIPSNSFPGGDLWSCVYATGVTCTQGA